MPKVSNKDIYAQDPNLDMEDYLLGTNYNSTNKKTQTYSLSSIFSLFYNFLGYNAFLFTTDTDTYPIASPGCFFAFDEDNEITSDFQQTRKLTFSSNDTYNFNVTEYLQMLVDSDKFLFKLINLEDKNNFIFLKPRNFTLSNTLTSFDVNIEIQYGLSNGNFENYKKYLLLLEFDANTFDPADYDLTDFTNTSGNPFVTAQDLIDALSLLPAPITNHSELSLDDGTNPHGTTKGDVGLGNVPNVDTSTTSNISEGSNLYFTTARVLATVLSGLSLATGGAIVSTDSILVAFGKIQKQIDDLTTSIGNKLDKVTTVDVEKVYIKNADGTQGTKPSSEFGISLPDLQRYSLYAWRPTPNGWYGFSTPVTVGTADNQSPSFTGNDFIKAVRQRRLSGATAGSSAVFLEGSFRQTSVGDGFFFSMKFGNEDVAPVADARLFAGLTGLGTIGNVNPSTLLRMIGVGANSGDTNLQFMHNDSVGTAVKVDLGSNFPANSIATDLYCFQMYNVPGVHSVWYRLINISTKVETAWTEVTTELPGTNFPLIPHCWRNNGTTALAVRLSLVDLTLYKRI